MIERKFVKQNIREFQVKEFIEETLSRAGLSQVKLQRTPLGEKIIVSASRPGLVVGRAGANIANLTAQLKKRFDFENPQIEIEEVENISLDANIIAEMIVNSLERFGTKRFKGIGHRAMTEVMNAGALGVEILISGKIPGARAKTWRFFTGHLKKCGEVARQGVRHAYKYARLKSGVVGVKVSIMPPSTSLPDEIRVSEPKEEHHVEEVKDPAVVKEMEDVVAGVASTKEEADVIARAHDEESGRGEVERGSPTTKDEGGQEEKTESHGRGKKTVKKKATKTKSTKTKKPAKTEGTASKTAAKAESEEAEAREDDAKQGAAAKKKASATTKKAVKKGASSTEKAVKKKATKAKTKKAVKKEKPSAEKSASAEKKEQ